jgi:vacuolar protein sorting-associated protein 13A/C
MLLCVVCSNPGHPFSSGVTLAKLAAVTMDEQGNETFDTSGALDRLRKVRLFIKIVL